MTQRPIAEKYCEGKLKRTSKEESKEPEIAPREPNGIGTRSGWFQSLEPTSGMERERRKGAEGGCRDAVATWCLKLLSLHEVKQVGDRSSGGQWGSGVGGQHVVP